LRLAKPGGGQQERDELFFMSGDQHKLCESLMAGNRYSSVWTPPLSFKSDRTARNWACPSPLDGLRGVASMLERVISALKPLPAHALLEEGNFRREKTWVLEGHLPAAVTDTLRRIARLGLAPCFGVAV
jgi:hypothetical protein